MNQQQLKYARNKLQTEYNSIAQEVYQMHILEESNPFTLETLISKIQQNDLEVNSRYRRKKDDPISHTSLNHIFDLSQFSNVPVYDKEKQEETLAPIRESFSEAMDELILGDSKEALYLIRRFQETANNLLGA